ncbi:MAG TPA: FHA domain-containing protein [Candidatus Thermoplasmatota archaeon]|jgi:hypothetical protein|nr:FHA domain-containing protein [Candidatus Thermoplasmatota archaeon]
MGSAEALDFEKLEDYFLALANSNRLELLHKLRFPHALQEIRLAPRQVRPGQNPDRPSARQTVQTHLDKLIEIGVVIEHEGPGGQSRKQYVVNGQRLYQVMEEFRKVGTIVQGALAGRDATVELGDVRPGAMEAGPKLVLVHGLIEGKPFMLRRSELRGNRGWIIGRKAGLHVSLDYDPYVSLENSEVLPDGDAFVLVDLRSSRNGTMLNWRTLEPDERATLQPGDVIGVGRSLLVFRPT